MLSSFPALPCTLALALLAGCSGAQESDQGAGVSQEQVRQFSNEERLAARALSIGSRSAAPQSGNPYEQAVTCSSAIEALADRLRQSDALTSEQLQIVEQAKAVYDRRIRSLTDQASAAGTAVGEDPLQAVDNPPRGEALQAIGCIQNLAEAG